MGNGDVRWRCRNKRPGDLYSPVFRWDRSQRRPDPDLAEARTHWTYIVEEYTKRNLSFSKDRLPALAAFARYRNDIVQQGEYLAGIWSYDLVGQLLWKTVDETTPFEPCPTAPSWSWAFVNRAVLFDRWISLLRGKNKARVTSYSIDLVNPNVPFGEVRQGVLTLCAKMLKPTDISAPLFAYAVNLDRPPWQLFIDNPHDTTTLHSHEVQLVLLGCELDLDDELDMVERRTSGPFIQSANLKGIILLGQEDGTYRRVGRFHFAFKFRTEDFPGRLPKPLPFPWNNAAVKEVTICYLDENLPKMLIMSH